MKPVLEKDFRNWAPMFASRHGVFLEIQRGAWEARKAFQRQQPSALPHYEEAANAFDLLKAYAAGWLCEPGIAYGKNPPFAPGGTLFTRMVNEQGFGVESLYAAYLIQKLASDIGFGRAAKSQTRAQSRYLFIMVVIDLVKDFLMNNGHDHDHAAIASAVAKWERAGLLREVGDTAVQMIDEYMTKGNEDTLFNEPEYEKSNDLNAFLKSEKLGKGDDFSPRLRMQMAMTKRLFRKSAPVAEMKAALLASS